MIVADIKSLLSHFHIKPDKKLGQNFLLSEDILDQIVAAAELTFDDRVMEIGPGLGFLTRRLAERAGEVIAVEKDRKLCQALRRMFKNNQTVKIIQGDALSVIPDLIRNDKGSGFKVVANVPYYLTGKILHDLLEGENKPTLMVLLLQKEVAERIIAIPGQMSILSVSVQFYADPEVIAFVPKENFYPKPEVDSAIVRLRVLEKPRFDVQMGKFFQLVKIGFSNKRKQLHNNLLALPTYDKQRTTSKQLLVSLGLNPLCRAQDLSLQDWHQLYKKII